MGRQLIFDSRGNDKQREVMALWSDTEVSEIVYGGSKGSGKSFLGCSLMLGMALMYPNTFYFIARKSLADLTRFTLPSIYEVMDIWNISPAYYNYNGSGNYFEFNNGSRIYLIHAAYRPSDPQYQRFGSMQMTQGWIEEAGEFTKDAKDNLAATVGRWKNDIYNIPAKLLMTCNPSNNFLYGDYYKPFRDGTQKPWVRFVRALPTDNKMLPKGYVEHLSRTLSPVQYRRLVLGEWEFDDSPEWLVSYDAVCDIFTNEHILEEGLSYISTDLAGKGRDKWVVSTWIGDVGRIPIIQSHSEGKEMEEKLRDISISLDIPRSRIVADADGLGFYLESYFKGINEFHGGSRAVHPDMYFNLKTECGYKLAEKINKRQIRLICDAKTQEQIKEELVLLRASTLDSSVRRQLIPKSRMKELYGGKSPDVLDVLMMRQIFDIQTRASGVTAASIKPRQKR